MKKLLIISSMALFLSLKAVAQEQEVQQLLLNVEKLTQLKQLLSDMKKGYQIVSSGYNTVKGLSEGNFNLHKEFLDGLMLASPSIRKYHKVGEIIQYQLQLIKEYKAAFGRFRQAGTFNPDELEYIGKVYDNLFRKSLENLDELATVVTSNKLRMSDDERLQAIDAIHADMEDKLRFLRYFNNNTGLLAMQREKEKREIEAMRSIQGIKK